MSNFGVYNGNQFLEMQLEKRDWLVEGIIRRGDSVILVGNEKSGKSLYIFQLICALTSGQSFLDSYEVINPCKVAYFQLEGELSDSQDRMQRMIKTQELNPENFHLYFQPPLNLHEDNELIDVKNTIEKYGKPDVLIIDPIYFAFSGSLNNDEIVRKFIGNIRKLKDALGCAVILVHHTHKQRWSTDGFKIEEGDEAVFGSKFIKAWADHILMFIYDKTKEIRTMSCATQRSGDIIKKCELKLIEPEPLYFEVLEKGDTHENYIMALLHSEVNRDGLTMDDICKRLKIGRNPFYASIKPLLSEEIIIKSKTIPRVYIYNWEKFKHE